MALLWNIGIGLKLSFGLGARETVNKRKRKRERKWKYEGNDWIWSDDVGIRKTIFQSETKNSGKWRRRRRRQFPGSSFMASEKWIKWKWRCRWRTSASASASASASVANVVISRKCEKVTLELLFGEIASSVGPIQWSPDLFVTIFNIYNVLKK